MAPPTILLAGVADGPIPLDTLADALRTAPAAPKVHTVDLGKGPASTRWRRRLGIGWHARTVVRQAERRTGDPIDAVVELAGPHHLLGLGRLRRPTLRVSLPQVDHPGQVSEAGLDRLAAKEGAALIAVETTGPGRLGPLCDAVRTTILEHFDARAAGAGEA